MRYIKLLVNKGNPYHSYEMGFFNWEVYKNHMNYWAMFLRNIKHAESHNSLHNDIDIDTHIICKRKWLDGAQNYIN